MISMGDGLPMPKSRGELREHEPMSRHLSWKAGGPADRFFIPADREDLCCFLSRLPADEPVFIIGLGSNLLVRDGGFRGTVVHLHGRLNDIRLEGRQQGAGNLGMLYVEAGVSSPKVARYAANQGLVGAEFLAGIPGTMGGALAMNAGCYGRETWEIVAQVQTVDRTGRLNKRTPGEFKVSYRHTEPTLPREEWFVAAWLLLPKGDGEAARAEIKRLLARRVASQPLSLPNAGSVFRNPPGDHAARLIESCGMKGLRRGGAQVSEKHANFIVNTGGATASDIEDLIDLVETTVRDKTGVSLLREVRIIGERTAA